MTADEILDIAKKTQQDDISRLENMININDKSKAVAADTMAALASQTDQLRFHFLCSWNDQILEKLTKDSVIFKRI